jgi:hypothetical protein
MKICNVKWIKVNTFSDARGKLSAIESGSNIPFNVKRIFYMHGITHGADRGGHAHVETDQFVIALHGNLKVKISDGIESKVFLLNSAIWGVFLPRLTWADLYDFSKDAICLVLASTHYDRSKSIRSWVAYLEAKGIANCQLLENTYINKHPQ